MAQALEVRPKLIVPGPAPIPGLSTSQNSGRSPTLRGQAHGGYGPHRRSGGGGVHQNPVPYADVVTTTTHKTLRGPRGGMILCKEEYAKAIDKAIFPGTQGGPLMHIIAAKAVCLARRCQPEFKAYGEQVVKNAQALAKGLLDRGVKLVSGGTDNHLMLIDLTDSELTGKELERRLDEVYITANKNTRPRREAQPLYHQRCAPGHPGCHHPGPAGRGHGRDRRLHRPWLWRTASRRISRPSGTGWTPSAKSTPCMPERNRLCRLAGWGCFGNTARRPLGGTSPSGFFGYIFKRLFV